MLSRKQIFKQLCKGAVYVKQLLSVSGLPHGSHISWCSDWAPLWSF